MSQKTSGSNMINPLNELSNQELSIALEGLRRMRRMQGSEFPEESSYIDHLMQKLEKMAEAKGIIDLKASEYKNYGNC